MGMFDYVYYDCPECGHRIEDQSKAGGCTLQSYSIENAPAAIQADMLGKKYCDKCEKHFKIEMIIRPATIARKLYPGEND